jgi:flavin reductase (DIM6/NTAB) family NADH-FMN oxidoreductase RutF
MMRVVDLMGMSLLLLRRAPVYGIIIKNPDRLSNPAGIEKAPCLPSFLFSPAAYIIFRRIRNGGVSKGRSVSWRTPEQSKDWPEEADMNKITTLIKKFQYFYPNTVALIGVKSGERVNFMSCAWHTALSFEPPLFGVLISKKRFTHDLVVDAREFTVSFLGREAVKLSAQMGRTSGAAMDKVREFQVKLAPPKIIRSPYAAEAYVAFECRLTDVKSTGDHDLFVGEVLAVHEKPRSFTADGVLNVRAVAPLLYLGGDFYVTLDPDTLNHVVPD